MTPRSAAKGGALRYAWIRAAGAGALLLARAHSAGGAGAMQVRSPAFADGDAIPVRYSCQGEDISPPLSWDGVPPGARSLALICDDPDAPMGAWVHWVAFDIPPELRALEEGVPAAERVEGRARQGMNDFGKVGYGGPCPPAGTHRYFFRLYALDKKLGFKGGVTKARLLKEMKGHVLAEGTLVGTYRKQDERRGRGPARRGGAAR